MVSCRCGQVFENSRWDAFVVCPNCGRVYPNSSPSMYHPKSIDELKWKCKKCGTVNDHSQGSCPRTVCSLCGTKRPGNPSDWY